MSDVWRLYETHARAYDRDRARVLMEESYLSEVAGRLDQGASVLDLGCGVGEPIARFFIDNGFALTGLDRAPSMIAICRRRLPQASWIVADMRALDLGATFDAILAWDSFFHLDQAEQRAMFPVFERHIAPEGLLLFTSGPRAGEAIGDLYGDELFHASLDEGEYRRLLCDAGFDVLRYEKEDSACGFHTVWLAQHEV